MPLRLLERALRRPFLPFLAFAIAGQVYLAWPWSRIESPAWALAAVALFALTCALAVVTRRSELSSYAILAPLLYLVVLALWRHAGSGAPDGLDVVALLSVAWTALFGTMRQVIVTLVAYVAMVIAPIWIVGAPDYPHSEAGGSLVTAMFAVLIAPTAQFLVRQLDRESARLDALLRAATGHSVMACDLDGRITMFNPGAERLLGWASADVLGRSMVDLVHDPGELARRAAELGCAPGLPVLTHAVTAAGGMETRDWTYLRHGGAELTVSLAMTGICNADGQLAGYMCVATDVTEARQLVRTLENDREVYRLLLAHLPMTTVSVLDAQLRCLTMGGHWVGANGIDSDSIVGKHIGEFFHEPDRAAGVAVYEAGLLAPQVADLDLSSGHVYRFEVLPVPGPAGERYVLSVARDVTDSRRIEQERERMTTALAVSEASFREAFDGAPIGIALTSVQDGPERFLRVNKTLAALLGRDPEDFVGRPVAELTHPEDMALQPDLTADGVGASRLRKRFLHASGRPVWSEVTYAIVRDRDGAPSHIIKHIQDIRAIKESERALLEALEQQRAATAGLRELDKMRREVVGTISHELRTPLTSIHGYLELLADEPLSPGQKQMIEVAVRNSQRLGHLVDNLLVLAKLDAADPGSTPFRTDVCVQDVVRAAIDTVRPEVDDRGQRLRTALEDMPATIQGDAEQLHRALLNLLSNASKYTSERGTIDVSVSVIDDQVRVSITDTGIGIPAAEQTQLFDRFFRASTARELAISGNGLGLAIVKSIVDLHDGSITVTSEPGLGSCFTISLPLAAQLVATGRAS